MKKRIDENHCASCNADLRTGEQALFVEEEVGRVFCSEECISTYFSPDIEALERDYEKHRQKARDLTEEERESFAHLRWVTLEQPDEIWRSKLASGDWKYTLISEFQPGDKRVWCVCQCLFLRGEPSFLFLAIPTRDPVLVAHYRTGERVKRVQAKERGAVDADGEEADVQVIAGGHEMGADDMDTQPKGSDGLADSWTDEETIRARMRKPRSGKDIPESQFDQYEAAIPQTLEAPDEVWSSALVALDGVEARGAANSEEEEDDGIEEEGEKAAPVGGDTGEVLRLYHFIKAYSDESPVYWYVVIARDTGEEGQIEILDSFPTNDPKLVETLRVGTLEYGEHELPAYSRLVH